MAVVALPATAQASYFARATHAIAKDTHSACEENPECVAFHTGPCFWASGYSPHVQVAAGVHVSYDVVCRGLNRYEERAFGRRCYWLTYFKVRHRGTKAYLVTRDRSCGTGIGLTKPSPFGNRRP
jgi:hypothetical protein